MKRYLLSVLFSSALFLILGGCRTLSPQNGSENPQPWAQPEKWEQTKGIPGFQSSQRPDY